MDYTQYYNLGKPSSDDYALVSVLDDNFDKLDTALKGVQIKAESMIADFDNPKEWTKEAVWAGGASWVKCEKATEKTAGGYKETIIATLHNASGRAITAAMMERETTKTTDGATEIYTMYDYMDKVVDGVLTAALSKLPDKVRVTTAKTASGYMETIETFQ